MSSCTASNLQIGTVIAPAILGANVVLRQYDTLALVVAVFGWFLSYDLKVGSSGTL